VFHHLLQNIFNSIEILVPLLWSVFELIKSKFLGASLKLFFFPGLWYLSNKFLIKPGYRDQVSCFWNLSTVSEIFLRWRHDYFKPVENLRAEHYRYLHLLMNQSDSLKLNIIMSFFTGVSDPNSYPDPIESVFTQIEIHKTNLDSDAGLKKGFNFIEKVIKKPFKSSIFTWLMIWRQKTCYNSLWLLKMK